MSISSYALGKLSKFATKKFTKKLSAAQLAAARRNIKKAIAASARKRAAAVGKVVKNPVKYYGKSVTSRSLKRKSKALNKISMKKTSTEKFLADFNREVTKLGRSRDIVRAQSREIRKAIDATNTKAMKLSKINPNTGLMTLKNDNAINRYRLKRILAENQKLTVKYNTNADILRNYHSAGIKFAGKRAELENQVDDLAARYKNISNQSLAFKAGTVARDAALVGSAGALTYAGIQAQNKRQQQKKSKKKS